MGRPIKCEHCKLMYDCEYTYLGECTNGQLWDSLKRQCVNTPEELSTKDMLSKPITDLAKLIGQKWFLPLENLAEETGVAKKWVTQAVRGGKVGKHVEQQLRDFLGKL